ncbi:MAG: clan AA aspartic protease [Rhizobacter sp.]|nr:clan AA aspartic protease [Chlorobiales bacterium]
MGWVHADIELINADDLSLERRGMMKPEEVRRLKVTALVNSGAYTLVVPESVRLQLGLDVIDEDVVQYANSDFQQVPVTTGVEIKFENRRALCNPVMIGDAVLLGAMPMEAMDVVIHPKTQKLIVNPEHPNLPQHKIFAAQGFMPPIDAD